jgi:hypothetical protein
MKNLLTLKAHLKTCSSQPHAFPRTKGIDEATEVKRIVGHSAILILPFLDSPVCQRKMTGENVESCSLVFQARQAGGGPEQIKSNISGFLHLSYRLTV